MDRETNCVGCGKRGATVCADCRELSIGNRSLRATRAPLTLALAFFGVTLLAFAVSLPAGRGSVGARVVVYAAVLLGASGFWAAVEVRRPIRFGLRGDALVVEYALGARRWIAFDSLRTVLGAVVDAETGVRYRMGEDRFPGAAEFHRVLRVRLALYRPTDFIASSG